jgi:hypothetical protein
MTTDNLTQVQAEVESHLLEQVANGEKFFKSRYIAESLGRSAKAVGANMGYLQDKTTELEIEKWSSGGSSGTTWLITAVEPDQEPHSGDTPVSA